MRHILSIRCRQEEWVGISFGGRARGDQFLGARGAQTRNWLRFYLSISNISKHNKTPVEFFASVSVEIE